MTNSSEGASPILLLEHWKPVVGFEGYYEVSNTGRVFSTRTNTILRGSKVPSGYLTVDLCLSGERVTSYRHDLVARAFVGPKKGNAEVNHIDQGDCATVGTLGRC